MEATWSDITNISEVSMKRFDYDENDEEPDFFSDAPDGDEAATSDENYVAMMEQRTTVDLMQLDLVQADLNQRLLFRTIRMLEKSWFWAFRSKTSRLRLIAETYELYRRLIQTSQQREIETKI